MNFKIKIVTKKVGFLWLKKKIEYVVGVEEPTHFCDSGYVTLGSFQALASFENLEDANNFVQELISASNLS